MRREQQARLAAQAAEQAARERLEQRAQQEAERLAAEQAARLHAERMAELERERQDRIRVQQAEARARIEHDARLRREQLHLEAQIRRSEQRARPRWPLVAVPALVLGLAGVGLFGWQGQRIADREAAAAEREAAQQADALAEVAAQLGDLQARHARLQAQRGELLAQLAEAKDDEAARAALQQQLDAVDTELARGDRQPQPSRRGGQGRKGKPRGTTRPKADPKPTKPVRTRPVLELGGTQDPLGGLD
ncbi:MAG: hypothetical protein KDK70_07500 [Myxococcales bacterium]|nr:hypothetical protein [Myxococcales bacterium]